MAERWRIRQSSLLVVELEVARVLRESVRHPYTVPTSVTQASECSCASKGLFVKPATTSCKVVVVTHTDRLPRRNVHCIIACGKSTCFARILFTKRAKVAGEVQGIGMGIGVGPAEIA